jgi:probable F420-dependent oxidoreductase
MKLRIAMPGTHHIPPADDRVPAAAPWAPGLAAPDFQHIVSAIDDLRYDAITTSEHLGMPYFEVPRLGAFWMDALCTMAFIAGASRRVRIDASVLIAPYHHPLSFAKALSTMDVLSGGRLDVSVGVGHAQQEFKALGVAFADRGRITDETLDAALELWSAAEPTFHGRFFDVEGLAFEPKPVQNPRPPIYVGGNSKPALRRAARFDGWQPNPIEFPVGRIPESLDYIRAQPGYAAKQRTFEVYWMGSIPNLERPIFADMSNAQRSEHRDKIVERLEHLTALGVTITATPVPVTQSMNDYLDFIAWFDEEVISRVAAS